MDKKLQLPQTEISKQKIRLIFIYYSGILCLLPLLFVEGIISVSNLPKETLAHTGTGIAALVIGLNIFFHRKVPLTIQYTWIWVSIFGLVIYSYMSILWSTNQHLALESANQWFIMFLLFATIGMSGGNKREIWLMLFALALGTALNACIGLYQHWSNNIPYYVVAPPSGTFLNRNFAAQVCAIGLPISIVITVTGKKPIHYMFGACCMVPLVLFIFHTFSRSAWIASSLVCFFIAINMALIPPVRNFVTGTFSTLKTCTIGVAIFSILLGSCLTHEGFKWPGTRVTERAGAIVDFESIKKLAKDDELVGRTANGGIKALSGRIQMWRNGIELLKDALPWGVGEGNFQIEFPLYSSSVFRSPFNTKEVNLRYLHQDYMELGIELGIPGLILGSLLLLSLSYYLFILLTQNKTSADHSTFAIIAVAGALISIASTSMFSSPLYWPTQKAYFFALVAILVSQSPKRLLLKHVKQLNPVTLKYLATALILAGGGFCYYSTDKYLRISKAERLYLQSLDDLGEQQWASAYVRLSEASILAPTNQHINLTKGSLLLQAGRTDKTKLDDAIQVFENLLQFYPNDYKILSNIASAHSQKKEYRKAIFYYDRMLKIIPADREASREAASLSYQLGEYNKTEAYLLPYARGFDSAPHAYVALIDNSLTIENIVSANLYLNEGLGRFPDDESIRSKELNIKQKEQELKFK